MAHAVVAQENDDGVIRLARRTHACKETANGSIHLRDAAVAAREIRREALGEKGRGKFFVTHAREVRDDIGRGGKPRLARLGVDEIEDEVRDEVGGPTFGLQRLAAVGQRGIAVLVAAHEVALVPPTVPRRRFGQPRSVGLAGVESPVAAGAEKRRHQRLVGPEIRPRRHAPDARAQVLAASVERGARGRARGGDDEVLEDGGFRGEMVEHRRLDQRIAGEPEVAEPLIVADDEEDIGPSLGFNGGDGSAVRPEREK